MEEEGRSEAQMRQRQGYEGGTPKEEEALEIQSLRRIISAYLNYADAAERDVRRYERSFKKLPHEHKAILSHLPLKYQKLRRCISVNTYFIMNMLQAFVPPFDLNTDIDGADYEHIIDGTEDHHGQEFASKFVHMNTTTKGGWKIQNEQTCSDASDIIQRSYGRKNNDEEINKEMLQESAKGDWPGSFEKHRMMHSTVDSHFVDTNCRSPHCCESVSNGNSYSHHWLDPSMQLNVPLVDVDKVRCIIRNIIRDWASEGKKERDQCYRPILEELKRLFPVRCKERPPTCLVPGAGLGRLVLEISCLGFVSQGNEFSYYMMICSSFILNHSQVAGEWKIYPWIHSNCNSISDNDQLRPVSFPDIHPASAGITEGFSMCAGDFVEVYGDASQEASWDAVVTCFFMDTAHNIVEYIEIISRILKDGGVWINLGPLLYHFADTYGAESEMSIELSLEDVKNVAFQYGFEMEMEKIIEATYTANPRSMMQNRYFPVFWTMRKKPRA